MGAVTAGIIRHGNESGTRSFQRASVVKFVLAALALLFLAGAMCGNARAATPTIVNQSSTGGQTNWLESFTVANAGNADGHRVWITVLVKHDPGRKVTGLRIDADYDGTDETGSETVRAVTAQQPTVVDGYNYSRVSYNYQVPTSNTGLDCGSIFSGGTTQSSKDIRLRAQLDNGTQTATSVSSIKWARTDCNAKDDMPYIYERSQSASSIEPGDSVTFTVKGDDTDSALTTNQNFGGISYRMRRLSDGATTGETKVCWGDSDNTSRSFTVNFPRRGRWVVEAEARNSNSNCDTNPYNNAFWYIGAVDVNSPASDSPELTVSATRPVIGGNSTVTATFNDNDDNSEGGRVQNVEWDLDQNTGNGVSGFEDIDLGDAIGGLSSPRTRTVDTSGMTPGLKTVRVRVTDNGAMSGADNIRRTKTVSTTIRVDSPPEIEDTQERTLTGTALPFTLSASDADADSLTYMVTDPPDHGVLSGSGANLTYTPAPGFAGTDQIEFSVGDGYGGTDTGTVDFRVDPDIIDFNGPTGTLDSRGGQVEFDSRATGATFECSLDDGSWIACVSPLSLYDLNDGSHEARVRVTAGGLTNPDLSSTSWTVDAYPHITLNGVPDSETSMRTGSVDFSLTEQGSTANPTAECKLDGHPWAPCNSPANYPDLDDGNHQIQIRATDAFGKQSVETVEWTVVTAGSDTTIDAPLPESITRDQEVSLNFSSSDQTATFECSLDGGVWTPCSSPADFGGLADGVHTFKVRDQALNGAESRPAQISWLVDRTAPLAEIISGPSGPVPAGSVSFEFKANEPFVGYECSFDGAAFQPCVSPFTAADPADGNHGFRVAAIDRAGNRSLAAERHFRVLSVAPPVEFTDGPAQGAVLTDGAASFAFTSAPVAPGYECRVDDGDWYSCSSPAAISGLGDGAHQFSVRAVDEVGNRTVDPTVRSWSVDSVAPDTGITSGPSGTVKENSAEIAFVASETGSNFSCSLDGAAFAACASPVTLDDLSDGDHEFRVRARDAAGNLDQSPAARQWKVDTTVPPPPDPPEPPAAPEPCDFLTERVDCDQPFSVASVRAPFLRWKGGARLKVEVDAGGSPLKRIASRFPIGTRLRATGATGRIGKLILEGSSQIKVPLNLPGGKGRTLRVSAADGPEVLIRPRTVVIKQLPDGITGFNLKLHSSTGLRFRSAVCGTRLWRSVLTDWRSNTKDVNARTDVKCVRKGGRR
jgi:hypothetical protein